MLIGILSDTHGLLRQEVIAGLKGVDHIIHAGDIDCKDVIDRLEEIAPVTAVRGNADREWAEHIPKEAVLDLLGNRIFVIHNKGKIVDLPADIRIIVFGHSHKYSLLEKEGQIWFNPGCCGKRKPGQEVSYAVLEINGPGKFEFGKKVIDNTGQEAKLLANIDKIISKSMELADKGRTYQEIAKKLKISEELAERICRMYLTHPGVDVAGILQRI